jgi:hypothetical protein
LIGGTVGTGWLFGVFAVHTLALHHCVVVQSVSCTQTFPHAPVAKLQMVPDGSEAQSVLLVQTPHAPLAAQ